MLHQDEIIMLSLLLLLATLANFANCQYNVYRQDPFAMLSRTLLTYQQAACDGKVLNLVCPTGTKISIQLVQYGRSAPSSQVRSVENWKVTEIQSNFCESHSSPLIWGILCSKCSNMYDKCAVQMFFVTNPPKYWLLGAWCCCNAKIYFLALISYDKKVCFTKGKAFFLVGCTSKADLTFDFMQNQGKKFRWDKMVFW